jgi:hypothetical protein
MTGMENDSAGLISPGANIELLLARLTDSLKAWQL